MNQGMCVDVDSVGRMISCVFFCKEVTEDTIARGLTNVTGYGTTVEKAKEDLKKRMNEINAQASKVVAEAAARHTDESPDKLIEASLALRKLVRKYERSDVQETTKSSSPVFAESIYDLVKAAVGASLSVLSMSSRTRVEKSSRYTREEVLAYGKRVRLACDGHSYPEEQVTDRDLASILDDTDAMPPPAPPESITEKQPLFHYWRSRAEALWKLLDDIDTLDDSCREHDDHYRKMAGLVADKRFKYADSDGYTLTWKGQDQKEDPVRDDLVDRLASMCMFRGFDVDLGLMKEAIVKADK